MICIGIGWLYLPNPMDPKSLYNGLSDNFCSMCMDLLYNVPTSFFIAIFDVDLYNIGAFYFINWHFLYFLARCCWYFLYGILVSPDLTVTLYGPLALNTTFAGFPSNDFDANLFLVIKMSPYLDILSLTILIITVSYIR